MLVPGKIEKVLCLGNVTDRSTFQYLQSLSPEFLGVKGEYDDPIIYHHKKVPATQSLAGQRFRNGFDSGLQPLASGSAASAAISNSHYGLPPPNINAPLPPLPSGNGNFAVPPNNDIMSNAPDGVNIHTLGSVSGAQPVDAYNRPYQQQQPQFHDPHRKPFSNNIPQPEATTTIIEEMSLPLSRVVSLGQLKIGFNSGHTIIPNSDPDALLIAARQLDVDIFIWGGTHRVEAYQVEGKFFVNPGSATGAFYTGWPDTEELEEETDNDNNEEDAEKESKDNEDSKESSDSNTGTVVEPKDPIPSFCLLDIQGSICVVYIYRYVDGEVQVDKISYRKEDQ